MQLFERLVENSWLEKSKKAGIDFQLSRDVTRRERRQSCTMPPSTPDTEYRILCCMLQKLTERELDNGYTYWKDLDLIYLEYILMQHPSTCSILPALSLRRLETS